VSSVKTLEDVKTDPHCLYLAMPVQVSCGMPIKGSADEQQFDTLGGFKRFSEVLAVGVESGREALRVWKAEGRLPTGLVDDCKGQAALTRGTRLRYVVVAFCDLIADKQANVDLGAQLYVCTLRPSPGRIRPSPYVVN
jgi:hypothetical protein